MKQFTVPESGAIRVAFTWGAPEITKGFEIPPRIVRALNQFCVDTGRLSEAGEPDTLGLFIDHNLGKIGADGAVRSKGLVLTIIDRYADYEGMVDPEIAAKAAAAAEKAQELQVAVAAAAAAALKPIEE